MGRGGGHKDRVSSGDKKGLMGRESEFGLLGEEDEAFLVSK